MYPARRNPGGVSLALKERAMTPTIPIDTKTFKYVPETLKVDGKPMEGAPEFTLRYGTRRDKHTYKAELAGRGLVSYSDDEIREAMASEMRRLSDNSEESKARMVETAERYWAANRALEEEIKLWRTNAIAVRNEDPDAELDPFPVIDFDLEEQAWITGIMQTVQANSAVIRNMSKANSRRDFIASEVALSVVLISAEGFELERDAENLVEPASLAAMEEWLGNLAEDLGIEPHLAGDAYAELRNMAFMAFHLPRDTEKNFASLLLATSALSGSQPVVADESSVSPVSGKSKATPSPQADTITSETSLNSPSPAEAVSAESPGPTDAP